MEIFNTQHWWEEPVVSDSALSRVLDDVQWCSSASAVILSSCFLKHHSVLLLCCSVPRPTLNLYFPRLSRAGLSCQLQPAKMRFALKEALIKTHSEGGGNFFPLCQLYETLRYIVS